MRTTMLRRGAFAALTAAALGFGTAQALAAPARPNTEFRGCTQESCDKRCAPLSGFCDGRGCWCL
ncbi:MAG TPA: hypothetical protein VF771_07490 [Longimicrobiaceae bacterium]